MLLSGVLNVPVATKVLEVGVSFEFDSFFNKLRSSNWELLVHCLKCVAKAALSSIVSLNKDAIPSPNTSLFPLVRGSPSSNGGSYAKEAILARGHFKRKAQNFERAGANAAGHIITEGSFQLGNLSS